MTLPDSASASAASPLKSDLTNPFPALPHLYAAFSGVRLTDVLIHMPSSLGLYSIGHYLVFLPSRLV